MTVLAEELGNFIPYIGGPEYAYKLISTLESLSAMEEPLVRDKAVESLNKIIETQTPEQIKEHFIPLIKRLSITEWFSSRVSATGLYASVVKKLSASSAAQEELLVMYKTLCLDEAPMVRRAAAAIFLVLLLFCKMPSLKAAYILCSSLKLMTTKIQFDFSPPMFLFPLPRLLKAKHYQVQCGAGQPG